MLQVLLADHLMPERRCLEGEMADLRKARTDSTKKGKAERRFIEVQKLLQELNDFIDAVTEIADKAKKVVSAEMNRRERKTAKEAKEKVCGGALFDGAGGGEKGAEEVAFNG